MVKIYYKLEWDSGGMYINAALNESLVKKGEATVIQFTLPFVEGEGSSGEWPIKTENSALEKLMTDYKVKESDMERLTLR